MNRLLTSYGMSLVGQFLLDGIALTPTLSRKRARERRWWVRYPLLQEGDLLVFEGCFLFDPEQSLGVTHSTSSGHALAEAQLGTSRCDTTESTPTRSRQGCILRVYYKKILLYCREWLG